MADPLLLHQALVDKLRSEGHIQSLAVEAAFRAVPRHLFLPGVALEEVYRDQYIVTKWVNGEAFSSSSQPMIMAIMLEQLGLEPGQRVLEIGAGTGYNAALMAHIVGDAGQVVTVDIDEDITERARSHLVAAGYGSVRVIRGDGGLGHPGAPPFDRIILTVGAWDIAPAWPTQLRRGGRLVLPLAFGGSQRSVAFEHADGYLGSVSVRDCIFLPLRGAFAAPDTRVPLGPEPGFNLWSKGHEQIDPDVTYALLTGSPRDVPAKISVTPRDVYGGLILWLAMREPGFCWLRAEGPAADRGLVPYLFGLAGKFRGAAGLLEGRSACLLMRPPDESPPVEEPENLPPFDLFVRGFGDAALTDRVLGQVRAWDAAHRRGTEGLRARAYPIDLPYVPSAGELVVPKRWTRLVLDWPLWYHPRHAG